MASSELWDIGRREMLLFIGSVAEHLREEGEPCTVEDGRGEDGVRLSVSVAKSLAGAPCPSCRAPSERVHSTYHRSLQDLSLQGVPVTLRVVVRRFRCDNEACPRATFAESFPELAAPRAQRTQRLAAMQTEVGLALGASAGARLLPKLGAPTSPTTLLRLVRRMVIPEVPTPRVLGVDDWALRRGHTYGTILIDQERRRPVALLASRESATLKQWLQAHPGVEIVTRDRAEAFAEGASLGAPNAIQVADRWHLFKNVSDALERVLQGHRAALAESAVAAVSLDAPPDAATPVVPPPLKPENEEVTPPPSPADARRVARQALYEEVQRLHAEGLPICAISGRLQVSRPTVRKYLRASSCPHRAPRRTKLATLSAFDTHLRSRWAEGCYDATVLWSEVKALGFGGSLRSVQRHVASWATGTRRRRSKGGDPCAEPAPPTPPKPPSPSLVRWWLTIPAAELSADQRRFVTHLLTHHEAVRTARDLAVEFHRVLRERHTEGLQPWIKAAAASSHRELQKFATGLEHDLKAVEAAIREPWSNGQTEGQVNKLKMLKRQCYGRAKLDLLERRLLAA